MSLQTRIRRQLAAAAALFVAGFLGGHGSGLARASPAQAPPAQRSALAPDNDVVRRGEYIARLGDCLACHTGSSGVPFAGGVPFEAPGGVVFSSNITPDRQFGIGRYTEQQFAQLLREGIGPGGRSVSPTMPYPSFSRVTDEDIHLLYVYMMRGVQPSRIPSKPPEVNGGADLAQLNEDWRKSHAPPVRVFDPSAYPSSQVARGAYIVQGLGHCGSCHSPRAATFEERALTDRDPDGTRYLAGGGIYDGWSPLSIRNDAPDSVARMSEAELVELLRIGRNHATATFGIMNLIVSDSTQFFSTADLRAVAAYLKSLGTPPAKDWQREGATATALRRADETTRGAALYLDNCSACHRTDGRGWERVFPALAGNPVLLDPDPTSIIRIVMFGGMLPGLRTAPSSFTMAPAAGRLTDEQIADVVSFVRNAWGNNASAVAAVDVAKVRKQETPADRARWQALAPPPR